MPKLQTNNMSVVIVGNGAIGNVVAYRCTQLGLCYGVITRAEKAIDLDFIDVNHETFRFPLPIIPLSLIGQSPLIILPVKAYQVSSFIEQVHELIEPWQTLVLLHNGMGTIEQIQKRLPQVNLVAATTTYGAFKPTTDQLALKGKGETHLGWIQHNNGNQSEIEDLLSSLLPPSIWHKDIRFALWRKLAINAAINPLTALYDIQNGELVKDQYQQQINALCDETTNIMGHLGFILESDELLNAVNHVIRQTSKNYSSMNRDIKAKRTTEIAFINGYIVDQASRLGLSSPLNLRMLNEIQYLETLN
jgi:2-dehydropantoate 2-reductase